MIECCEKRTTLKDTPSPCYPGFAEARGKASAKERIFILGYLPEGYPSEARLPFVKEFDYAQDLETGAAVAGRDR